MMVVCDFCDGVGIFYEYIAVYWNGGANAKVTFDGETVKSGDSIIKPEDLGRYITVVATPKSGCAFMDADIGDWTREGTSIVKRFFELGDALTVEVPSAVVLGTEDHPWPVGANATAWTNGVGKLVIEGTGAVRSAPWTEFAAEITEVKIDRGVTDLPTGAFDGMKNLQYVNDLLIEVCNSAAVGAVKVAGFSAIAVENGKATLTLVVKTAATVDAEEKDWTAAATTKVEVDAPAPAGFFIVAPAK